MFLLSRAAVCECPLPIRISECPDNGAFWKWHHPDNGSETGLSRDHKAGILQEEKQEKRFLVLK